MYRPSMMIVDMSPDSVSIRKEHAKATPRTVPNEESEIVARRTPDAFDPLLLENDE